MMNRIILGLGLGFMMWFSLFFMTSVDSRPVRIVPRPPVTAKVVRREATSPAAPVRNLKTSFVARQVASVTPSAQIAEAPQPAIARAAALSLADLRRLTFEKHQDLFARLIDPAFKPWAWLVGVQPHRRAQMQRYLSRLNERGVAWNSKQELASADRRFQFETEFRIVEDAVNSALLKARVDLRIRFDGQELLQTSFEDEARIATQDGRPYAMFDLSQCPTELNEHFAIVLMSWPDGHGGGGDFRVLGSGDERWHRGNRAGWVQLAPGQVMDEPPVARSESCAFVPLASAKE